MTDDVHARRERIPDRFVQLWVEYGRSKTKGVESNHIFLKSWLDISLTFTKLTIFFIRIISWAAIINLITSKRLCNAVFIFAAQKLILAVGICAYFRPYCFKSQLSNRFVGQYEAKKKKGKREKNPINAHQYIVPHRNSLDLWIIMTERSEARNKLRNNEPKSHVVILRKISPFIWRFHTA